MASDTLIELKNLSKSYDGKTVVDNLNLTIKKGEFVTFLGPSGCGKTTTLRMIAGFERPDSGQVFINGEDYTDVPPYKKPVNTVFQKYALFPHLNVFKNIAFGLKLKMVEKGIITDKKGNEYMTFGKLTKQEIQTKVDNILKMVDLEDYGHRNVSTLSGGQQQRVAIARALVNEPEVLLLDEPLGALDLKMRKDMQLELINMHKRLGITFVYVTHDQEEALTMSDKIVVMRDGVIQQIATPKQIYDEPANAFVADFIGESNIFSGIMLADFKVRFCEVEFECVDKGFKKNEPIDVIIRPEDFYIFQEGIKQSMINGTVLSCVFKGDHYQITTEVNGFELLVHDNVECSIGDNVGIFIKPNDIHIMRKSMVTNEIVCSMWDVNLLYICGIKLGVSCELPSDTKVIATIGFKDIEILDDEADGQFACTVISSIYKGNYFQCQLRSDDNIVFFVDTKDDWMLNDRVGLMLNAEKMTIAQFDETEE